MTSESFNDELRYRLEHLHERTPLLDAGIVDHEGHVKKGDRTEEPMSKEAIDSIVESFRTREKVVGRVR